MGNKISRRTVNFNLNRNYASTSNAFFYWLYGIWYQIVENVAFNKSTWLQYPFDNVNYSAVRAVDGRKSNLHMLGGECAVSLYGYNTTEWRVDLGDVLYIHHIVIQYATQNFGWGTVSMLTYFTISAKEYYLRVNFFEKALNVFIDNSFLTNESAHIFIL